MYNEEIALKRKREREESANRKTGKPWQVYEIPTYFSVVTGYSNWTMVMKRV